MQLDDSKRNQIYNRLKTSSDPQKQQLIDNPNQVPDIYTQQQQNGLQRQTQEFANSEVDYLMDELNERSRQMFQAQQAMSEIAELNHYMATMINDQSYQIDTLYQNALQTTSYIEKGNVNLDKTIQVNKGGRQLMFWAFIFASVLLLFFDWLAG